MTEQQDEQQPDDSYPESWKPAHLKAERHERDLAEAAGVARPDLRQMRGV